MNIADIFTQQGLGAVDTKGSGNWPRRGVYVVSVVNIRSRVSQSLQRKGHLTINGDCLVHKVLSEYPDSQRPGETMGVYFDLNDTYSEMHKANLKSFLLAILGDVGFDAPPGAPLPEVQAANARWGTLLATVTEGEGVFLAGQYLRIDCTAPRTTRKGDVIYPPKFHSPTETDLVGLPPAPTPGA